MTAHRTGWNRSKLYRLRRVVMLRDDFTCQDCGLTALYDHKGVATVRLWIGDVPALKYDGKGLPCADRSGYTSLTLDHIVPYSLGGEHTVDNIVTLCQPCNSRKGARV